MKKVLFVATVMIHIQSFHLPYLRWFKENGFEVHVACNTANAKDGHEVPFCDYIHNIPFARSPLAAENMKAYKALKEIINENEFILIHAHTPVGGALARLAAKQARKNNDTKVIYTAHGFHFYKGCPFINKALFYSVEKYLSQYTDCLITINDEDYNAAISGHFKAKDIVKVNGVGIDLNKFTAEENFRCKKRKEFGIAPEDIMLLSVGELNENKNHKTIIKAVAKLAESRIKYVICGSGVLESELRNLSKELGTEGSVIFAGYRNDTKEIYQAADIFIFPSLREGLPVSVMEAMASGVPIIASDIRGNKDLIVDGKGGYLISDPTDYRAYAEKIAELISNNEECKEIRSFNLERIKLFSIDNVKEQMIKIYEEYI